jgi:hypothetical protein
MRASGTGDGNVIVVDTDVNVNLAMPARVEPPDLSDPANMRAMTRLADASASAMMMRTTMSLRTSRGSQR